MHDALHPEFTPTPDDLWLDPASPAGEPATAAAGTEAAPVAALPGWFRVPATGDSVVDAMLVGSAWVASAPLTYSFPDSRLDFRAPYGGNAGEPSAPGFDQVSFEQQQAVRYILEGASPLAGGPAMRYGSFEAIAALDFHDVGQGGDALLRFAMTGTDQAGGNDTARAYFPHDPVGGDIWFGNGNAGTFQDFRLPVPGNFAWATHLHEIGHALGLKHPHAGGGPAGLALPIELDNLELTVMSYRSYPGAPIYDDGYRNGEFGYPQTLMMLDIQALQHVYGPNWATNAGDTRYGWDPGTGEMLVDGVGQGQPGVNRVFLTVWDGGGTDTYDLSNHAGPVSIDLRPGAWSVTSDAQRARLQHADYGEEILARGNVYNALLFEGHPRSLIENAVGGPGNDAITGNDTANHLQGGAGNDALLGGAGDDLLAGDAGNDVLAGGAGHDRILFGTGLGSDSVVDFAWSGESRDTLVLGGTGWAGFAELLGHARFDEALGGTAIAVDDASVLFLLGVSPAQLTADSVVLV